MDTVGKVRWIRLCACLAFAAAYGAFPQVRSARTSVRGVAVGENMLRDDFAADGMGGILDWGLRRGSGGERVERLGETGPDGRSVLRISGGNGPVYWSHPEKALVPGEKYRISAKVRTHALDPSARNDFEVHKAPWDWSGMAKLPADTNGEWRDISWEGEIKPSRGNMYGVTFYFSRISEGGYADISSPCLVAMTEKGTEGVSPRPDTKPFVPRIVPVDPLLNEMDADDARMDFFFPGDIDGEPSGYEMCVRAAGRMAAAPLGDDRHAKIALGALPEGRHTLVATLRRRPGGEIVAQNKYCVRASRRAAAAPGRRLNNFVVELRHERLKNGDLEFHTPRDGWVLVGLDAPHPGVVVDIDGQAVPAAIVCRKGEKPETMRRLKAGRHVATVRGLPPDGEGSIFVRSVRTLQLSFNRMSFGNTDFNRFAAYNSAFHRRFGMYDALNTATYPLKYDEKNPWFGKMLKDRGCEILSAFSLSPTSPVRCDLEALKSVFRENAAWKRGDALLVDENAIGAIALAKNNYAEAMWDVGRGHRIDACLEDAVHRRFGAPAREIPELSATLNAGDGTSQLVLEVYLRVPDDESGCAAMMDYWCGFARKARSLVPSAPGRMVYMIGGWVWPGVYNTWCRPECDIKAFYDGFIRMLATDPVFADIGGIGFSTPACDEELLRFVVHAMRHYGVEGSTESLSEKYGLKFDAGIMCNGDFTEGVGGCDGWTLSPAESGSLRRGSRKGFNFRLGQRRVFDSIHRPAKPWGDGYMTFTKSASGTNILSRTLRNLVPGRLYEVMWCSYDTGAIEKRLKETTPADMIQASVGGCTAIPEIAFDAQCDMSKYERDRVATFTHRIVFRATAPTAPLRFADCGAASAGAKRSINWIGVRPFFIVDEGELDALKAFGVEREPLKSQLQNHVQSRNSAGRFR